MNRFIKRNQKKILAIFSAGLMIAFALPTAMKQQGERTIVQGTMGNTKVRNVDIQEARAQWELLKRTLFVRQRIDRTSDDTTEVPLLGLYLGNRFRDLGPNVSSQAASQVISEIDGQPELFYLLRQEAEQMGITPNLDALQTILTNAVAHNDGAANYSQRLEEAIRSFLMVLEAAERGADVSKISRPLRDNMLMRDQKIGLNLVEFKAKDYLDKVPEPTPVEKAKKIDEQYNQYKNQEPATRPTNEFGFGYRVPNQVRIQSIELDREAIRRRVSAQISEADARKFFYQNIAQYPPKFGTVPPPGVAATQPSTQPATRPIPAYLLAPLDRALTTAPSATGAGSRKYFEEYREEIYKRLIDDGTTKLTQRIVSDINSQMNADYAAFKRAVGSQGGAAAPPATAPATMPATALANAPITPLGVPYNSYGYMQALAGKVEKDHGVFAKTFAKTEGTGLRTAKELAQSGPIGQSSLEGFDFMSLIRRGVPYEQIQQLSAPARFANYIANFVDAFADDQTRQFAAARRLRVLNLYEPSQLFVSIDGDKLFIFRVSEAVPAHAPQKDDVIAQLATDVRLQDAYKLAREDAKKFLDSLLETQKTNPAAHLQQAAASAGKPMITTGLFSGQQPDVLNYKLPAGDAANIFVNGAYSVLSQGGAGQPHPAGLIDYRPGATVVIGEINQIEPTWTPETLASYQLSATAIADRQAAAVQRVQWFRFDDTSARTHYKPTAPPKDSSKRPRQEEQSEPVDDNLFH